MSQLVVLFLLFFLPLIFLPFGFSPFEVPKIIFAEILIELLVIYAILYKKLSLKKYNFGLLTTSAIIVIVTLFQLILLNDSGIFFGNIFRLQGIFLLWHLLIFSFISSTVKIRIGYWIPAVSGILLFLSTFLLVNIESGRSIGTLGEPNALAATAIFFWPFLFFSTKNFTKRTNVIRAVTLTGALSVVFLAASGSALIALIVQLTFICLTYFTKISTKKIVAMCLILILSSFSLVFLERNLVFENRLEIWRTAYFAGLQNPILGSGFGSIQDTLHQSSKSLNNNVQYQIVDSSHNFLLDWWVQAGLVGVGAIIFLIYSTLRNFVNFNKKLELVIFIGLLTTLSFNPASVASLIAFWWLIGQGFAPLSAPVPSNHSISSSPPLPHLRS